MMTIMKQFCQSNADTHTQSACTYSAYSIYTEHTVLAHTHTHCACATLANEAKKVWPALYYTAVSRDDDDNHHDGGDDEDNCHDCDHDDNHCDVWQPSIYV